MSSHRQIYVAVVDDDESLCRSLARLLRAAGIQPVTYPSAEAFLADTRRPQFDCLVLDIQLGGMSGLELHRELVAAGSKTPVVYITAHEEPAAREKAWANGCVAFFNKNESGQAILEAIRRAAGVEEDKP
jgi:FixJ family two-component response regulator